MQGFNEFRKALYKRESGGKYNIKNKWGYLGAAQFGKERLWDLGLSVNGWKPKNGVVKKVITEDQFLSNPELQDAIFELHVKDILNKVIKKYSHYLNTTINGIKITDSGCVAGVHLKGWGGLSKFLINHDDNTDALGTPISEYISKFGGYNLTYSIDEKTLIKEIEKLATPKGLDEVK
jgi:hypothetical protein